LLLADVLWCLVRYKVHNFAIANAAALVVQLAQWPIAILGFGILIYHKHFALSLLSLLWPLLYGLICITGKIGVAELNFAREIGYIDNSEIDDF